MAWFNITARAGTAEIFIHDEIGRDNLSAKDFSIQLRALGRVGEIALHINSPGGSVSDGLAIFNMLKAHPASVTVTVDGVAASIASLIAMAGDKVIMPSNTLLMIHDARALVMGPSDDLRHTAETVDKMNASMVGAYATKTGLSRQRIREMMRAESWLSADEALALGFADEVTGAAQIAAHFDLSKFEHPPSPVEAMSQAYWSRQKSDKPVAQQVGSLTSESKLLDQVRTELPTPEEAFAVWNRKR